MTLSIKITADQQKKLAIAAKQIANDAYGRDQATSFAKQVLALLEKAKR